MRIPTRRTRRHGAPACLLALALLWASVARAEQVITKFANGKTKASYVVDAQGRKQGTYREFHPDGTPKIVARYHDDQFAGPYTEWNARKRLVETTGYRAGRYHGWRRRYKDGVLVSERAFLDGVLVYPKSLTAIGKQLDAISRTTVPGANSKPVADGVRRLMAYRYLCDVPFADMRVDEEMTRQAQAAADICQKLGRLSHKPDNPGLDDEQYKLAKLGASVMGR